jgi:hypothetical protein
MRLVLVVCLAAPVGAIAEAPSPTTKKPVDAAPAKRSSPQTTEPTTPSEPPRLALVGRTAENWIYIDKPSLRKLTNDKYELWAQVKESRGDTVKLLLQLNCSGRSYLVKSSATYTDEGAVLDSYTPRSPSLQYIVPDSAAEYIHGAICK